VPEQGGQLSPLPVLTAQAQFGREVLQVSERLEFVLELGDGAGG
jgi:hypothetical protein